MLWLILSLGVILRVYALNAFPLEQDELYTINESIELFNSPYLPGIRARPLYYLLQHPLSITLPHTAVFLRLLPLLFGVAGIWITWRLARHVAGHKAGLAAALFTAISPWHLYISGMARYWAMVYFLTALGYLLILRASEIGTPKRYAAVLPVLIAAALTHPTAMFPLPGIAVALFMAHNRDGIPQRMPAIKYLWLPFIGFLAIYYLTLKLTGGASALQNWNGRGPAAALRLVPAMADWTTLTVGALALVGSFMLLHSPNAAKRTFARMALLGPLCSTGLLLIAARRTDVYADYGAAMLPLVITAAGVAIQTVAQNASLGKRLTTAVALVFITIAGSAPSIVSYLGDGSRFDYRWAYKRIAEETRETPVLTWPLVVQEYYAPKLKAYPLLAPPAKLDSVLTSTADVSGGEVWAVVSIARYGVVGDGGELEPWLSRHCKLIEAHQGLRFDYRVYRVELQRCTLNGTSLLHPAPQLSQLYNGDN